jgi:Ca2+-binding EF-hand superfamily protein
MVASISSSTVSDWSNALFSKLDTKQQGYIEKSDIEAAFAKTAGTSASGSTSSSSDTTAADQLFAQLDGNKDGKVTQSELSAAVSKVADQLNAQYDQGRVAKGGQPSGASGASGGGHHAHVNDGDGARGGGAAAPASGSSGSASSASSTSSASSSTYSAAADTNGDGTVSADEAAAYAQLQASGGATTSSSQSTDGLTKDQLNAELQAAGSSGGKHAAVLSKLVDNFDKADTNGDGKVTQDEAKSYLKSAHSQQAGGASATGTAGTTSSNDAASALANALQVLKAYVDSNQSATSSVSVNA